MKVFNYFQKKQWPMASCHSHLNALSVGQVAYAAKYAEDDGEEQHRNSNYARKFMLCWFIRVPHRQYSMGIEASSSGFPSAANRYLTSYI